MRSIRIALAFLMILGLGQILSLLSSPLAQQQPILQVSPTTLEFQGQAGGPTPDPQALTIANAGGGLMEWKASTDVDWIVLGGTEGQLSGGRVIQLWVFVKPEGLEAGDHRGAITIEAPEAQGSPVHVAVTLMLTTPPRLEVTPTSLSFAGQEGGANPTLQTLTIRNTGGEPLSWTASTDATWINLGQTQGELRAGGSQTVAVTVRIAGLPAGTYNATITVTAPEAQNSPVIISVRLTIKPRPPYTVCSSGCPFTKIQPAIDAAKSGDTITVGPGTYRETLTITKGLVLKGAGRDRTVIQGVERGRPVIRIESGHLIDVTIQGLTITGARALPNQPCAEFSKEPFRYLCPGGIEIWGQVRATIKDNKIVDNADDGVDVFNGGYAEITDNLISQNGYEGIHLQQARAKISNNAVDKNGEIGILVWIDSEAEIRGNEINDTKLHPDSKIGDGIEIIDNSKATIEGNTIERSARHGIWVGGGHYYADPSKSFRSSTVTIKNNIIKDSEDCGIYAAPPINIVSCSGNTVSGNKGGNYCGAARGRCY